MKLRTWLYFFRQACISLWRNAWMSVAAGTSVAVTLFIVGAFILLVLNINFIAFALQSSLEIAVFLRVDTPRSEALALEQQIEKMPGVKEVELVPKEQGLKILAQQLGSETELLEATGGVNPLPDYLRVKVEDPSRIGEVASALKGFSAVEKVNYGQAVVERLLAVLRWVRLLGVGIIGLLVVASLILLMITIRLAVYARRREINIMKYVGATDWFIRWPFLLEGLFIGLFGGSVAAGLLAWGYSSLTYKLKLSLFFLPLLEDRQVMYYLALGLVSGGGCVGSVGSLLAIHRFLKV